VWPLPARSSLNYVIEAVGALNQGYPLLQYEDTVPVRRSLAARRTAPDPPRGWLKALNPRMYQLDRTSARKYQTPVRTTRTPDYGPGLPSKHVGSLGWGPDPSE
jgi:hypothetical protein